jgi:hypothetical protein
MQDVDLKILEDVLTSHLIIGKGELYLELLKNKYERDTYLSGVRKIILLEKYSTELLSDFFVSYGFSNYFSAIDSIKEEYFDKISEEIFLGHISPEFISLIDSDSITLKEQLEYLACLKLAYKFQGRKELKEHLCNLESLSQFEISEDVINNVVKVQIRKDLKARLNELEKSEKNHDFEVEYFNTHKSKVQMPLSKSQITLDASTDIVNKSTESSFTKNSISTKITLFTKYALAAIFIGIISITTIVYNYRNNDYDENFARNTDTKNNEVLTDSNIGLFKINKQQRQSSKNFGLSIERDSINSQKAKDSINVNAPISKRFTFKYRYIFTILLIIVGILSILVYFLKKRKK